MADNKQAGAAVGSGPTFATDEIGGVDYPRAKLVWGVDGTATDASASNPLPVVQTGTPGLPTGAATAAKQDTEIASLATLAGAVAGTEVQVDVLTMPTVAVTGTFYQATQPVSATSLPLPSGAATAAKQPALGTAGSSSADVISVQGIASGTAMPVSLASVPSHAVTNAGTFATQVDGAALTALQLIDDTVFAEDTAAQAADKGIQILAVRRDADTSLVGTDNDYAPLQVNAAGSLKVAITAGAGSGGTAMADDAAFTPATTSITPVGGTYRSTLDAVDDGDAGAFAMTANRAVHVNLRDASGNELAAGAQYAEDAVHASGDFVTMAGVVRKDTATQLAGTDGDNSVLVNDASGRLHVNVGVLPASTNTIEVVGDAAHDAAIAGNPVRVGIRGMSADYTAVATGDTADALGSLLGKQVNLPFALPANTWSYAAPAGGLVSQTAVTVKAAAGAGIRNYVTSVQIINSHATISTEIMIVDGAAGTVLWRGWAQAAGGGIACKFDPPLRGTANTLLEIDEVTATGTAGLLCNLQGFVAAE